ncbi:MAG: TadE/TadG family type IV pilus assembly protein [Chakrabartia sp.]
MKPPLLSRPARRARQSGAAIIELALVLPFLLLLCTGVLEAGRAIYMYKRLVHQAELGARFLSSQEPLSVDAPGQAECLVYAGLQQSIATCPATPLIPGLTLDQVSVVTAETVSYSSGAGRTMNIATVKITGYQYPLVTGAIWKSFFGSGSIAFGEISVSMRQTR